MAINPDAYAVPYTSEATIGKYTAVKKGSAVGSFVQATAATDKILGILGDLDVVSGNIASVVVLGPTKAKLGGSVVAGDHLTATTAGALIAATRHTHTENTAGSYTQNATTGTAAVDNICAIALEDGASGDYALVLVVPQTY